MTTDRYDSIRRIVDTYYAHMSANIFRLNDPHPMGFHYTSGESVAAILDSRCFRLTNVRFMNDPMELKHSLDLLSDAVRPLRAGILIRETAALEHLRDHVVPKIEERSSRQFILSLSLSQDSKVLWKSYAHDDGCALEFDIPELIRGFESLAIAMKANGDYTYREYSRFNGILLYDPTLQRQFISDSVSFITRLLETGQGFSSPPDIYEISNCLTRMTHLLYAGLYNMKGELHSKENEYRFVVMPDPDYTQILTRERSGRIESYAEVKGVLQSLRRIWCGPYCRNAERITNALDRYIRASGLAVAITTSTCDP
jgi:hypothetical protein